MLMQEKQYGMSHHLVLCTDLLSPENLSSKSMLNFKRVWMGYND